MIINIGNNKMNITINSELPITLPTFVSKIKYICQEKQKQGFIKDL